MAKLNKGGLRNTKPIKGRFNKAVGRSKSLKRSKRNYSQKRLIQKMDRYAAYGKGIHKSKMLDIKDKYLKHYTKTIVNRGHQDRVLKQAIEYGFQSRDTVEKVDNNRKLLDQSNRNKAVAMAKRYYHRNYSMSKEFSKANRDPRPRSKNKPKDKG